MQEIEAALTKYMGEWQAWATTATDFAFGKLKPMHLGWKFADEAALSAKLAELMPHIAQGHIGTVDNRKIVLAVPATPVGGVPILQLMQLRPGSSDPLGLDHVAFYCADMASLQTALQKAGVKWEHQSNPGHQWISMWFGPNNREAKFFDHTSLELGARELSETSEKIKAT